MATVIHCDMDWYLIHGHTCIGVQSNTEQTAHAHLSPSVQCFPFFFYIGCDTEFTIIVLLIIFITHSCPCVIIMSGKGNVPMKGLRIKRTGKWCLCSRKWRYWDKLGSRTSIAVVRHHYCVNELRIHFIKKNEDKMRGSIKTSVQSKAEFSC